MSFGCKNGLYRKPTEAKKFYVTIAVFTAIATALNFVYINPMRACCGRDRAGFFDASLMLLIMFMTNDRTIMGDHVNGRLANTCGFLITLVIFFATVALVVLWWQA